MSKRASAVAPDAEYWADHIELIKTLGALGFKYPPASRLDLFWLRNRVRELANANAQPEAIQRAIEFVDRLVILRTQGREPKHKNGKYI